MNDRPDDKLAVLVIGPESGGTRLLTSLLMHAGFAGDSGHVQSFDEIAPADQPRIAWRRSLPHGIDHEWPDLGGMMARLRADGYGVRVLAIFRDWSAQLPSQIKLHTGNEAEAVENSCRAVREVAELATAGVPLRIVTYEALLLHPHAVLCSLCTWLNVEAPLNLPEIYDANLRHYRERRWQ